MSTLPALWSWLRGKKTYIVGAGSILLAVGQALSDNDWHAAFLKVETALLAMGIRHGM